MSVTDWKRNDVTSSHMFEYLAIDEYSVRCFNSRLQHVQESSLSNFQDDNKMLHSVFLETLNNNYVVDDKDPKYNVLKLMCL